MQETYKPGYKKEIYSEIIAGIREYAPDLIICVSLSGRTFPEIEKRMEALSLEDELKPDMGSLTLSSLNFNKQASINEPDTIIQLAQEMKNRNIKPELEAFDAGMINYIKYLAKKELIAPPYYVNLILGNIACAQADLLHTGIMIRDLPDNTLWSLAGIGDSQFMMNAIAISMNGGVRVGLEDNIWFDKQRTQLATNLDLLKRIHSLIDAHQQTVMKPCELRKKLNLQPGNGLYGLKGA